VSDEILTERNGRILVITINRPESRKAVNLAVSQGLGDAVDELDENPTAPLAVAVTKEILVKSASWSEDEMWKKQLELIIPVFSSNDAKEGAIAFAEKRKPNRTGT
jgi:enoyl-CoA hydratase/carnithine racemase